MKASFNTTELDAQLLPYSIKFIGNNACGSVDASSTNQIRGDQIWIAANYTDCGIKAYHEGNRIAFEQTILVEYGSKTPSSLVFRYFNSSYKVKCVLDRNVTANLKIDVIDRQIVKDGMLFLFIYTFPYERLSIQTGKYRLISSFCLL